MTASLTVDAADLYCGGGGSTTGMELAITERGHRMRLVGVNHDPRSVETHRLNHPDADHYCTDVNAVDPNRLVPSGHLHLLWASPECQHFSGTGGRRLSEQRRAGAWAVQHWVERILVDRIIVENVPGFRLWGPLDAKGKPIRKRYGEKFNAWLGALRAHGYTVDWALLNGAHFGAASDRLRLFVQASLDGRITWPDPDPNAARPARDVINWEHRGRVLKPNELCENTLARIEAGLRKFNGEPFIVVLRNHADAQSLDESLPTIAAQGNHLYLAQPFILGQHGGSVPRSIDRPLPAITGDGAIAIIEPSFKPFGIRYRQLQVDELAAGMQFPKGYKFAGTPTHQKKQVGNAVQVGVAAALTRAALYGVSRSDIQEAA